MKNYIDGLGIMVHLSFIQFPGNRLIGLEYEQICTSAKPRDENHELTNPFGTIMLRQLESRPAIQQCN